MSEQRTQPSRAPSARLAWLRSRLLPGGEDTLLLAAYAMVLAALVTFTLNQRDLPAPRFYLGLLILAAMLVLNVVTLDVEARLGHDRGAQLLLAANGALWLTVAWIAIGSAHFSFVPFLLFMLVAQAVVSLPAAGAALYVLALVGGWSAVLWVVGFTPAAIGVNLLSLSTGLIFVVVFSVVLTKYREQTRRTEALLAQLKAANAELEAARRRERELAVAEERVRLARDIHDGLGHHLTALNVQLQAAARLIERDPARAAAAVATSREVAQAALDEVRQSVAAMRRTPLDGRSLGEALAALAADFGRRADVQVAVTVTGEPAELAPAAAQTLYRAAQEGLTNAQRHGGARSARIALTYGPATTTLAVTDDGAATGAAHGSGFGLAGLRERAEQLGGTLAAGPAAGGGFALTIEIPLTTGGGQL
jgi:signal transduction histidine kinase